MDMHISNRNNDVEFIMKNVFVDSDKTTRSSDGLGYRITVHVRGGAFKVFKKIGREIVIEPMISKALRKLATARPHTLIFGEGLDIVTVGDSYSIKLPFSENKEMMDFYDMGMKNIWESRDYMLCDEVHLIGNPPNVETRLRFCKKMRHGSLKV